MEPRIEKVIEAAAAARPTTLLQLWTGWQGTGDQTPEAAVLVAEALIGMAQPDDALAVLQNAGDDTRPRQLRAMALRETGRIDEAIQQLEALRGEGPLDAETGGLLAACYKRRGLADDNPADLRTAYTIYLDTYEATGSTSPASADSSETTSPPLDNSYVGINAASLALTCHEAQVSARIAHEVLAKVSLPLEQMDQWKIATRAEAHLLLGDLSSARTWYGRALVANPNAVRSIAAMRRQARANLAALGLDEHALDDVLVVRKVAAFTGHMTDAPGRPSARFPASAEGAVRLKIREQLKALGVGFGFSSAARGSDVIFLEELLNRGGRARVFLPFAFEQFVQTSVGPDWRRRVERILADPRVVITTLDAPPDGGPAAAYQACCEAVAREAVRLAAMLGDEAVMVAVYDGQPGDGEGGTADAVQAWQRTGAPLAVIAPLDASPAALRPAAVVSTRDFTGTSVQRPRPAPALHYDHRHCLCVGIGNYPLGPSWPALPNARRDAEAVGRALAEHHGFSDPLYLLDGDATAQAIGRKIAVELQERARENDLVVVFFAGHGHTTHAGGLEHGYIVPVDARGAAPPDLVSVNQLTDWSTYLECRHLLYIFDSCFSGMFQKMAGSDGMSPDPSRARVAITSGQADQVVLDGPTGGHSPFAAGLLDALRHGVGGNHEFTATELYSFLRRRVREQCPAQTPTLAILRNHEGGEILFQQTA